MTAPTQAPETYTRVRGGGSQEEVAWPDIKIGDVLIDKDGGKKFRVGMKPLTFQEASDEGRLHGQCFYDGHWYHVTDYVNNVILLPIQPDVPFGKWEIGEGILFPQPWASADFVTFEEVADNPPPS